MILNVTHNIAKNHTQPKAIIHMIWDQILTYSKMNIIWMLHSCWSQWCKSQPHIWFLGQDT